MAKVALIAEGDGWGIREFVCTLGPADKPFDEQHRRHSISLVLEGSFHYRCPTGAALLTPGSLMLGNPGECYRCGHEHGVGDRCLSFHFTPERWAELELDTAQFSVPRLPPLRDLAPVTARAAALAEDASCAWPEEIAVTLAGQVAALARRTRASGADAAAEARVARVVRTLENDPDAPRDIRSLARIARLSPYHFLRVFEVVTGTTPHQYGLRARLRRAALRLRASADTVLEVALESGFGDVSNFHRAFRREFGVTPKAWRDRG